MSIFIGDNKKEIKETPSIIQRVGDRGTNNFSIKTDTSFTVSANAMSDRGQMVVEIINPLKNKTNKSWQFEQNVYDKKGVSRALKAGGGSGNIPKIIEEPQPIKRRRSEYGKKVRKAYEKHEIQATEKMREHYIADDGIMPTITASRREQKIVEPYIAASRGRGENNEQHLEPNYSGTTNTITSVQKDNYAVIPQGDNMNDKQYRIRKLTPLECWRLMGFDESDFRKAEKVNSNSQLYKQAGNSIVVNVLENIFKKLLVE